ncbi:MAG: PTS lactose/cellobiose transporter subunit IIA [Tyzzerella sp.]|uniref:PTS lactose/cellobiose transporter subunit IIA n=1 Tax=Candidatus Fimicola merdigallinarum TaxID=2840819 RepID=A0A9D9H2V6_9FIRM|nr:PTS lactose/cellobiose transporter subunit IIA [Candidatus Fimicola merdigallinarum]
MDEKIVEIAFQLISYSGDARGIAMEAIHSAKNGNIEEARNLIKEAREQIHKAHEFQTQLIQDEAAGIKNEISILLIHSQDHFMTGSTVIDMAEEFVDLYDRLENK